MLVIDHLDFRPAWLTPTHQNSKLLLINRYTTVIHILFLKQYRYSQHTSNGYCNNYIQHNSANTGVLVMTVTLYIIVAMVNVGKWKYNLPFEVVLLAI